MNDVFSQGLPFWQSVLVPNLGTGSALVMKRQLRLMDDKVRLANLRSIDKAFR